MRFCLTPTRAIRCAAALIIPFLIAPRVPAQTAPSPSDEKIERLLKRIDELENRLKNLEAAEPGAPKQDAGNQVVAAVPVPAAPVESLVPAVSSADQAAADAILQEANGTAQDHHFGKLEFRGFTDFTFGRPLEENLPVNGVAGSNYSFSLGDLSLFMTSRMSEHLSFYSELLITSDFTNSWSAELDRAVLQYKANDYFQASFGRFNTALGYYTNGINRAKYFQNATDRPFMYTDEDAGGVLPVHSVGVSMTGAVPTGPLGLHWVAELSNGVDWFNVASSNQNLYDNNNRKAYNVGLFVRPEKIRGLQIGVSDYRDVLEPQGEARVAQNIIAAYIAVEQPQFEFLSEAAVRSDSPAGASAVYRTLMGYTQISRRFHHVWRPYVRLEYMDVPSLDPLIGGMGIRKDYEIGLRYEIGEFFVIKSQVGRTSWHGTWAIDPQMQLAFTF